MKRMIDPHESREDALRLQFGDHRLERNARAREGERTRAVEGGDRDGAVVARDQSAALHPRGRPNGEHGSFAARARFHETRPQHDDPRGFFQRKHAGDASRGDLSHAVTDDGRGLDAPGFPQLRERHLHRKDRRLRNLRPVHLRGFLGATEFFEERKAAPTVASRRRSAPSLRGRPARARISSRPMPHHCGPCPLMMKPMRGACSAARSEGRADLRALLVSRERRRVPGSVRSNWK